MATKTKPRVIDADGHVMETHPEALAKWRDRMPKAYRDRGPRTIPFATGGGRTFLDGKIWPAPLPGGLEKSSDDNFAIHTTRPGMYDPHVRVKDMDLDSIDTSVLFGGVLALAMSGVDDGDLAAAVCRAYNSWLADYCGAYPDRLKGMCALPLQSPKAAAQELQRGIAELGLVAAHFPTNVHGRDHDDRALDPVYAASQDLDVPVCVHGGYTMPGIANMAEPRSTNQFYLNLLGFPFELMTAMAKMIAGGVFDRYPRLRAGYFEGNASWLPFWMERMDDQFAKFPRQVPIKMKPSEYVRTGSIKVTCDYEEQGVTQVIDAIGVEPIMYASDYWHADAKFPGTVDAIAKRKNLSPTDKRKILGDNAAAFFGI